MKKLFSLALILGIVTGIFMRFHQIAQNQFFFYDEGMWLNASRAFVELTYRVHPQNLGDWGKVFGVLTSLSLASAKSLWLFISSLRGFFVAPHGWYFSRLVSAVFGVMTIALAYLFARRYYASSKVALLVAGILALLPGHIFYSRLALQESLSMFLFLTGMYFYIFSRGTHLKTFLSAIFFALTFFSNYRMILIPVFVGFSEAFESFAEKKLFDVRKYIWNTVGFFAVIFLIGSLYGGKNIYITFAWMFHQSDLAKGSFDWFNFLSYPYYLFKLESVWFALLFFANIYFFIKKDCKNLLPFALSLFVMILFSFPQEKGVRYLCFVMPFMAMAAASSAFFLWKQKNILCRGIVLVLMGLLCVTHLWKAKEIIQFKSVYEMAVKDILQKDANAKIFSTQDMIQSLFVGNPRAVQEAPQDFPQLIEGFHQGIAYLVIDPQSYVSWTKEGGRFSQQRVGYMEFIVKNTPVFRVYPHFSRALLERFVLEHNENLRRSLQFLSANADGHLGELQVYDLNVTMAGMKRLIEIQKQNK